MARHGTTAHHLHHGHLEHHSGGHMVRHHIRRKHGGKAGRGEESPLLAAGNPDVVKEAKDEEKSYEAKKGGRIHKRRRGGLVRKAEGGKVHLGLMHGGAVRPRLDRPGRKSGGRVGSDTAPLSSAHHGSATSETHPKEQD